MNRFTKAAAATVIAAGAALATLAPSPALATEASDIRPRLERACLRIPNVEIRTENLIERLRGDAQTRGSLEWLQVQIDRATDQGRTQLAEVLQNRLAVRTKTLEVLELRQGGLPKLRQLCIDHGVDL